MNIERSGFMNNIELFKNESFGEIRTIIENEQVLFCAKDVASALGYDQPLKAIDRHCKKGRVCFVPHLLQIMG